MTQKIKVKRKQVNGGFKDRDSYLDYHKQYYQKNRERILARKKADPWNTRLKTTRTRAREKGLDHDLDREYLDTIYTTHCPVLGIELSYTENTVLADNSATLDRIDPELGYIKGNVQVLSHKANRMKSNATTEELLQFAEWVRKTYGDRGGVVPPLAPDSLG
jgi:hypothetical protein